VEKVLSLEKIIPPGTHRLWLFDIRAAENDGSDYKGEISQLKFVYEALDKLF